MPHLKPMRRPLMSFLLFALGCAPFPPSIPVVHGQWAAVSTRPAIGCWALTAPAIDTLFLQAPGLIRLTDSATWQPGKAPTTFALLAGSGVRRGRSSPRLASWTPIDSAGGISFGWGNGFVGIQVVAVVTHDSLRGHGHTYSDMVPPTPPPDVPVVGHRVPCDSVGL